VAISSSISSGSAASAARLRFASQDEFPDAVVDRDGPDLEVSLLYHLHLLPVHTFMRVKQIEPTLQMQC
jgi:hypothetical protein